MTYEYKVLVLPADHYEMDQEVLNLHGEKGWRLITVLVDASGHRVCYLQRSFER